MDDLDIIDYKVFFLIFKLDFALYTNFCLKKTNYSIYNKQNKKFSKNLITTLYEGYLHRMKT